MISFLNLYSCILYFSFLFSSTFHFTKKKLISLFIFHKINLELHLQILEKRYRIPTEAIGNTVANSVINTGYLIARLAKFFLDI